MFLFCQRRSPEGCVSNSAHSGFSVFRDWGAVCIYFFLSFFFLGEKFVCSIIVSSKAFKEPFASCRTTRLATHRCPQNCVKTQHFLPWVFFLFLSTRVETLLRPRWTSTGLCLPIEGAVVFWHCSFAAEKPYLVKWDPEPLIWRVDRFRKNKNKKMSFYHRKKKKRNKNKMKWLLFFCGLRPVREATAEIQSRSKFSRYAMLLTAGLSDVQLREHFRDQREDLLTRRAINYNRPPLGRGLHVHRELS